MHRLARLLHAERSSEIGLQSAEIAEQLFVGLQRVVGVNGQRTDRAFVEPTLSGERRGGGPERRGARSDDADGAPAKQFAARPARLRSI